MHRTWKKILALTMVAFLLAGSCNASWTTEYAHASRVQDQRDELTSDKPAIETDEYAAEKKSENRNKEENKEENTEKTSSQKDKRGEKGSEDTVSDEDESTITDLSEGAKKEEGSVAEETSGEKASEEAASEDNTGDERSAEEGSAEEPTAREESTEEDSSKYPASETSPEQGTEEEEILEDTEDYALLSTGGPHDVDMPDVTSHYFRLQKNSTKVSSASGTYLKVVSNVNEASRYISTEMKDGTLYSFTPRKTSTTTVTVGGGSGGSISLSGVAGSDRDRFGDIYNAVNAGRISSKVFNLSKCSSNPYALYTNVGTWYDTAAGKTYSVDMKMEVTGYLFPSEKIRDQLYNKYTAPYVGFNSNIIGITVMGTDYVQTAFTFYYHGTSKEISDLHGVIQFCDVDAQQGVDFGSGFQKIIMFKTSGSHLQYNSTGIMSGTRGYVSSRTVENVKSGDANTTVLGVFTGSKASCRWTIAKCDHEDTGGSASYGVASGFGIPADSSQADAISYYKSNSTGFLGIYADLGLITLPPEIDKNEYRGDVDSSKSSINQKEMRLSDREEEMTFVLTSAAASPSDIEKANYTVYRITDTLEAAFFLKKEGVKVYTEKSVEDSQTSYSDVTGQFTITADDQDDHRTRLTVEAKADSLNKASFYGRTYYVHIPVRIRTEEELEACGLSISDWYQEDESLGKEIGSSQSYRGLVAIGNKSQLYVVSNQGTSDTLTSPTNGVRIPMRVLIRKFGDDKDMPAKGVTFALYGGEAGENSSGKTPLMTAVTDEEGYAWFEPESDTFYDAAYGDGPYYIAELSVPDQYKDVWSPAVDNRWCYVINSLSHPVLLETKAELIRRILSEEADASDQILRNQEKENPKNSVKAYKRSSDTGEFLAGAEFMLYEWSEKEGEYMELMTLTEGKDEKGDICYYNAVSFRNTMDNLGRYKVLETKAPAGCLLAHDAWEFTMGEETREVVHTFDNSLQKVALEILKKGEDGKLLPDVVFQVKAAEDIYAPWASEDSVDKASSLLVSKGTVVDTVTTDEEGIARSSEGHELYIGEYLVEEIQGAKDYILDTEPHRITPEYASEIKEAVIVHQITVTNPRMQPAMAVAKLADRTVNPSGESVKFNRTTGRYVEKKADGIYNSQEPVDFTITVTNTGNVDLYDLKLVDSMDQLSEEQGYSLKEYVEEEASFFEIPREGYYVSAKGNKINVSYDNISHDTNHDGKEDQEHGGDNPLILLLDQLPAQDSVEVHFLTKVKDGAANAYHLKNHVKLTASYQPVQGGKTEPEYIEVPTEDLVDEEGNLLTEDWDHINIPGEPAAKVAKLADKTTGAALKDGRYEGTKTEGLYEYGETVDFTLTVTNSGTAQLYQILVEDTPDPRLYESLERGSVQLAEGTFITARGQEVHAVTREEEEEGSYGLLLDTLSAGDSVELHLIGKVRSGAQAATGLKNTVRISAEYQTGRDSFILIPRTPEMEDDDTIGIAVPLLAIAKLADKTTGASLKNGRYTGIKNPGTYQAGEHVLFTLTVTNKGNGTAKDLVITERPSGKLLQYVKPAGYQLKKGETITTSKGNTVEVTGSTSEKITLDQLLPGDSVDILYECIVKQTIKTIRNLENQAKVTGKNPDGSKIPETPEMKDEDAIHLKEITPPSRTSVTYPSSYPKTGDSNNIPAHLAMAGLALAGIIYSARRRRRHPDR